MKNRELKELYEAEHAGEKRKGKLLTFKGAEGFDVYNCSVPFYSDGKRYIWGRVEKNGEWASSNAKLFREVEPDVYELDRGAMIYPLEDPAFTFIGDEAVMCGTHVVKNKGNIETYFAYFYRGKPGPEEMKYFTTGPREMKDIRLVELPDGRIGIFSRPRGDMGGGITSAIGFNIINSLDELDAGVIASAKPISGLFEPGEWGGANQAFMLTSGNIGVIAHMSYRDEEKNLSVYANAAFVYDYKNDKTYNFKIIGTRAMYPQNEPKMPYLADCVFTSGIVKENGEYWLYSGIGDTAEGKIQIDYPFEGYGEICGNLGSESAAYSL